MKQTSLLMIAISTAAGAFANAPAVPSSDYNDNPPYNFHGEVDKTDIFAIPLDNSEEEQDEELEQFEEYSKTHKKS